MKIHIWNKPILAILVAIIGSFLLSCNEDFAKIIPLPEEEKEVDVVFGAPKVLLLVVDGARGESVRQVTTPNLNSILPKSIYTWNSLSEENAESSLSNWLNILTGVDYRKHGVRTGDFSQNKLDTYPLVYDRLKEFDENAKISFISRDQSMIDRLGGSVENHLVQSDDEVTDRIIEDLKEKDITFITAQFSAINDAGNTYGYDHSIANYREAIQDFDEQVGRIKAALEQRENYSSESWLVVITSSQGGFYPISDLDDDKTIFSNPNVNTFTIMYSPKYTTRFVSKPYIGNRFIGEFMHFTGKNRAKLLNDQNDIYFDLDNDDFTIELKVKKNRGRTNNYSFSYPSLLGKRNKWESDMNSARENEGWVIFLDNESWVFNARGDKGGGEVKPGKNLNRGSWNTIVVSALTQDSVRRLKLYNNGEMVKEEDITGWGKIASTADFTVGYLDSKNDWSSDAYIADVKIWKTALGDDVVKQYSCEVGVDPNHPYLQYLVGHWPMIGGDGHSIMDEGPLGAHLTTDNSNYPINMLSDYLCAPSSEQLGRAVPRGVDIATQIISWLKVPRQTAWGLDGRVWLDK